MQERCRRDVLHLCRERCSRAFCSESLASLMQEPLGSNGTLFRKQRCRDAEMPRCRDAEMQRQQVVSPLQEVNVKQIPLTKRMSKDSYWYKVPQESFFSFFSFCSYKELRSYRAKRAAAKNLVFLFLKNEKDCASRRDAGDLSELLHLLHLSCRSLESLQRDWMHSLCKPFSSAKQS
jgi:hypothetical protein